MKIQGQQYYPFPPAKVLATYGDPAHIEAKHRFLSARNIDIQVCEVDEHSMQLRLEREVPAEAPSMLKKFIAEWNRIRQEEQWTGDPLKGYQGKIDIAIEGVPVTIRGDLELVPDGEGCTHRATLHFDSKIPLVGKKLAEFVANKSEESMHNEFAFVADYLQANQ